MIRQIALLSPRASSLSLCRSRPVAEWRLPCLIEYLGPSSQASLLLPVQQFSHYRATQTRFWDARQNERRYSNSKVFTPPTHPAPSPGNSQGAIEERWPLRLITIMPVRKDEKRLVCEPQHTTLAECRGTYEVLAELQDAKFLHKTILVHGSEVYARNSLRDMLLRLRTTDEPRKLWVEPLCINHLDKREQQLHPANVASIYEGASRVLLSLPVESAHAAGMLALIRALADLEMGDTDGVLRVLQHEDIPRRWKALQSVLSKKWWHETASVIKFAIARKLYLKHLTFELDIDTFTKAMENLFNYLHSDSILYKHRDWVDHRLIRRVSTFLALRKGYQAQTPQIPLRIIDLLSAVRPLASEDARDKVFTVLQLGSFGDLVHPDYTKDPAEVFRQTAKAVIQSTGNLELLSHANSWPGSADRGVKGGVPSWCPDWKVRVDKQTRLWLNGFSACGGRTKANAAIDGHCKSLTMQGTLIDRIRYAVDLKDSLFDNDSNKHELAQELKRFFKSALRANISDKRRPDQRFNAVCATFVAETIWPDNYNSTQHNISGSSSSSDNEPAAPTRLTAEAARQHWLAWADQPIGSVPLPYENRDAVRYQTAMQRALKGRRLILTDQGHVGLADRPAVRGDEIWVFQGGRVPFCVRGRAEDSRSRFVRSFGGQDGAEAGLKGGSTAVADVGGVDGDADSKGDSTATPRGESRKVNGPNLLDASDATEILAPGSSEESMQYRLVGEAYLHGFMDGEAMERIKSVEDLQLVMLV